MHIKVVHVLLRMNVVNVPIHCAFLGNLLWLLYSENEAPVLDVANILYAFPMCFTDQENVQELSLKLTLLTCRERMGNI